jgi:ankyrin repeat protein
MDIVDAAENGELETVRAILTSSPALAQKAIYGAARFNHVEILAELLKHGADLNLPEGDGRTALHHAAEGAPEAVQFLIQNQVNLDPQDENGFTPMVWAIRQRSEAGNKIASALLEAGAKYDLHAAVSWGDLGRVKEILQKEPDTISKLDQKKQHAVFEDALIGMGLIEKNHVEMLEALFQHGLRPSKELVEQEVNYSAGETKEFLLKYLAKVC